ncbi:winged helix DNA-binding domain-containing protein [Actinoplanes sp. KI2]|uniref:winged helix DNA-binding domain-containing protein n=1 Tax=Actinoplanes sp. KI2 TaxID=2983315 RepID=UPI0021D5ADF5|nr:winged helix DNA-binding domain-containing protein [Actinoplanes sp. KI2]MCU7725561.1 winged helix DNA-binding domain-containing protein [Actinoplanes sp. KI2]
MSRRAVGRATLARQHLLARATVPAIDAVEHLAGMQCQAPLAPYVGLWTRLQGFRSDDLSRLIERRQVVRLHMMRNTLHLVSAADCLAWRALFDPLLRAEFAAHFRLDVDQLGGPELFGHARELLRLRPQTRRELGRLLNERWPGSDPTALAYAVTHHLPVCQVPPRGVWGKSGQAKWALVEDWLGAPLRVAPVDDLVRRYFGAFGPATVADVQVWSGLTRLAEVIERMGLHVFRGPDGQTLFDLPDAPRPAEDTPAPPRFLPEYDNLLLSHQDRGRVNPDGRPVPLPPGNGATSGTFLIDGVWRGTWSVRDSAVHVEPFGRLPAGDRDPLLDEAARLATLVVGPDGGEVVLDRVPLTR